MAVNTEPKLYEPTMVRETDGVRFRLTGAHFNKVKIPLPRQYVIATSVHNITVVVYSLKSIPACEESALLRLGPVELEIMDISGAVQHCYLPNMRFVRIVESLRNGSATLYAHLFKGGKDADQE